MHHDLRFGIEQDYKMPKKVLVIEDKEKLRKDILEIMGFEGYTAEGTENGSEGLNKLSSFAPNLVICDTNPPQIDSYAILKHLKSDPLYAKLSTIILTSKLATLDDQARAEFSSADYLEKPFHAVELLKMTRR